MFLHTTVPQLSAIALFYESNRTDIPILTTIPVITRVNDVLDVELVECREENFVEELLLE